MVEERQKKFFNQKLFPLLYRKAIAQGFMRMGVGSITIRNLNITPDYFNQYFGSNKENLIKYFGLIFFKDIS